ncbi:MAG: phosphohistidine phosphatase SixA [Aggregatilineales bacterium]
MRLYLMRHGSAEDMATSDHARQLTSEGREDIRRMAKLVGNRGIRDAHIFASPRTRAQQTAEIMAIALNSPVQTHEDVNFSFNLAALTALIAGLPPAAHVFFIGHNPSMSEVVSQLTGTGLGMKTGAIACIDLHTSQPRKGGMLLWYLYPKLLTSIVEI